MRMNTKLIALSFFVISSNVAASQIYNLTAIIKHNDKTLSSPKLKLVDGHWGQIQSDDCIYASKISEQPDNTLLVKNDISCGDFASQPIFILNHKGDKAKLETGEKNNTWVFSISVSVQK